jgi:hypothetical protein
MTYLIVQPMGNLRTSATNLSKDLNSCGVNVIDQEPAQLQLCWQRNDKSSTGKGMRKDV